MDITASNAIFMLSVTTIFPAAQRLQGYSADAAFATDAVEIAQTGKGVDGKMFAGYTPYNTPQNITIMPDSPSLPLFLQWVQAMKATQSIFVAQGSVSIPSIRQKWTLSNGVLQRIPSIPSVQKVLQAMEFQIVWDNVDPAPF
ncbi:hypothetical protein BCh11DRAFT_06478 [Burkholderia sp. Ch1-1]|nr:hypothetical protein BCh11DRAFT_06478 [Burkholderia sp. Ch1-1]